MCPQANLNTSKDSQTRLEGLGFACARLAQAGVRCNWWQTDAMRSKLGEDAGNRCGRQEASRQTRQEGERTDAVEVDLLLLVDQPDCTREHGQHGMIDRC